MLTIMYFEVYTPEYLVYLVVNIHTPVIFQITAISSEGTGMYYV